MKKKVFWTRDEFTKVADAAFVIMLDRNIKFPLSIHERIGLAKIVDEAQCKVLPVDRHAVMHGDKRERLIPALNYRYKKFTETMTLTTQPVVVTPPVVPVRPLDASVIVPGEAENYKAEMKAVNEIGQLVGAYLSSDRTVMKNFLSGLVTAFTTK